MEKTLNDVLATVQEISKRLDSIEENRNGNRIASTSHRIAPIFPKKIASKYRIDTHKKSHLKIEKNLICDYFDFL